MNEQYLGFRRKEVLFWTAVTVILFAIFLFALNAHAATLNLKATWTPNTESDMAGYNLYRTDGTRTKVNATLIPFLTGTTPTNTYSFSITVADSTTGTLSFILTAVDTSANESGDSNTATYPFDFVAPKAPTGLTITK